MHKKVLVFVLAVIIMSVVFHVDVRASRTGVFMSVSGKVLRRDTGQGLSGIEVRIINLTTGRSYHSYSGTAGAYQIKMVPEGQYRVYSASIHKSCPTGLFLESRPEDINVRIGRNIIDLNLYLTAAGSISGRVLGPDGSTPISDAVVRLKKFLKGKPSEDRTDSEGRYKLVGLGKPGYSEGQYYIVVRPKGFANQSRLLSVKNGENVMNFDFVVGTGNINVTGKVLSAVDNQPVKGASVFILSEDRHWEKYADGFATTDQSGNFSIKGFKNAGRIEISVFHDDYEMLEVPDELKMGENNFNLRLTPMQPNLSAMRASGTSAASSGPSGSVRDCCEEDGYTRENQLLFMCQQLSYDRAKQCIKNSNSLDCMQDKCSNDKITVICDYSCEDDRLGYTWYVNTLPGMPVEIYTCMPKFPDHETTMLHELFHACDRSSPQQMSDFSDYCEEARAYAAEGCIFNEGSTTREAKKYVKMAKEFNQDCHDLPF